MKKKRMAIFLLILIVFCTAGFAVRYLNLNRRYPKPEQITYQSGDTFELEEIEVTLMEKEVLGQEEFFSQYGIAETQIAGYYESHPTVFLLAEFRVKNTAQESRNYQTAFSQDAVEYKTFANGEDISFFPYINEYGNWDGNLLPGEEREILLAYPIPKTLMTEKHWKQAKELPYQIVLRNYPEKIVIR